MNKAAFIDKAKAGLETRGFQCERRRDDQIRCKELQGFSYVITYLAGDQDRVTIEAYFAFKDGTSCEAALAKVNEFNAKLNTATGFCDDKGAGFGTYVLIPKRGIDADELGRFLTWFGRSISTGSTKVGLIDLLK